jgi:hypothetical protein
LRRWHEVLNGLSLVLRIPIYLPCGCDRDPSATDHNERPANKQENISRGNRVHNHEADAARRHGATENDQERPGASGHVSNGATLHPARTGGRHYKNWSRPLLPPESLN